VVALVVVAVGGVLYLLALRRWRAALGLPPLRSLRPRRRRPSSSAEDDHSPLGGTL
jgi:hypothetical protein